MQIFLLLKSHHLGMISHLIFLSLLGTIIFPYGELTTPTRPPIPKSGVLAPNSRIDAYALNTHVICGWLYINVLLLYRWRRVVICSSGHEVRYRCSRVMPIGSCAIGNRRQLSIDACNGGRWSAPCPPAAAAAATAQRKFSLCPNPAYLRRTRDR